MHDTCAGSEYEGEHRQAREILGAEHTHTDFRVHKTQACASDCVDHPMILTKPHTQDKARTVASGCGGRVWAGRGGNRAAGRRCRCQQHQQGGPRGGELIADLPLQTQTEGGMPMYSQVLDNSVTTQCDALCSFATCMGLLDCQLQLHRAAIWGQTEVLQLLIARGAVLVPVPESGTKSKAPKTSVETAEDMAARYGQDECRRILSGLVFPTPRLSLPCPAAICLTHRPPDPQPNLDRGDSTTARGGRGPGVSPAKGPRLQDCEPAAQRSGDKRPRRRSRL